ncbi:MAG: hypothetical protein LBS76_03610 [Mycoplasmataceae bacterium]|nr:hypothetical protein [Mycoplasmataceae bacterium]
MLRDDPAPLSDALSALLVFLGFFATVIVILVLKKIYMRLRFKKRYYIFPRTNVKGIANIAMVISIAVATLLLLTVLSAGILGVLFRAYPGWRVNIEGILIKIGGLLFGPIIGMFIGAVTDLLSIALTAGMFHYGYFIACILFGLLSGLVRVLLNSTKGKQVNFAIMSSLAIGAIAVVSIVYVMLLPEDPISITFGVKFSIHLWQLSLIIGGIYGLGLIVLWICMFIYYKPMIVYQWASMSYWFRYKFKMNRFRKGLISGNDTQEVSDRQLVWWQQNGNGATQMSFGLQEKRNTIDKTNVRGRMFYFVPVLVTILIGETLVSTFILPEIDATFTPGYYMWLGTRILLLSIMIPLNIAVIYPVYRIVCPAMKYNYVDDSLESIKIPFMVD